MKLLTEYQFMHVLVLNNLILWYFSTGSWICINAAIASAAKVKNKKISWFKVGCSIFVWNTFGILVLWCSNISTVHECIFVIDILPHWGSWNLVLFLKLSLEQFYRLFSYESWIYLLALTLNISLHKAIIAFMLI